MYAFNPQAKLQWLELGQSRTRALLIDDALLDLTQICRDAAAAKFRQDAGSYYPGIRAELPQAYARTVLEAVYPLLLQLVQPPPDYRLVPQQWYLSLLTTPAAQLQPLQRLPHFDKAEPLHLAILHYLAEGPHGGTGFFQFARTDRFGGDDFVTQHRPGTERLAAADGDFTERFVGERRSAQRGEKGQSQRA